MEQEIRELLEAHVAEGRSVLEQIEAGWSRQARRPTAAEVDAWIGVGQGAEGAQMRAALRRQMLLAAGPPP
jgi:hypothetical protein